MKYVNSGSGKIPFISLLAILSISLTVNLPGLAISPIMGKLDDVFHHVTEMEIQLLTVLPNLVTIPFILFSGKLCTPKNQIFILALGLALYTLTGVLYFFATTMVQLILLSCLLGVGCGMVIPLAASLISQHFVGTERTRQLGMKSSLSNFTVIIATLFVGWIAAINWHLAFIVYLIPLIPLCLTPFMTFKFISTNRIEEAGAHHTPLREPSPMESEHAQAERTQIPPHANYHFRGKLALMLLFGVMFLYFIMTYGIEVVSYYIPFTMKHYSMSTGQVGVATAMFFASATVSGFLLTKIIGLLRKSTMFVAIAICAVGLLMCGVVHTYWSYILSIFLMGLGYGVVQPVIYDKISYIAPNAEKSTAYFSYLLTCNYIGISMVPFIVSGMRTIFAQQENVNFSYLLNAGIVAVVLIVAIIKRKSFVFSMDAHCVKEEDEATAAGE